ncbi:TetR/AcrR family transcriptional regulator [Ferrovibrio sp.]|uniref:TetR/AcrR family transcriptional regulator n=1 Tax=Ferrovibrio sp. TaxID=1917215 RepID=UPI001B4E4C59|nr:TetR/AcrR family transcriptional regulator [Ferrovibrio sp.]MBP7066289.1 TetR/AcrR family transcriptional regulator [Ferrovibrio sp.]
MNLNSKEAILAAAKQTAQAHGYGGINFRDLADQVGIKAASVYHHFPSKAELGAAVARRYWQDLATVLDAMLAEAQDAAACLHRYPGIFRRALENGNRMCLCSFMAAEYDDLPEAIKLEIRAFGDVNVAWLSKVLAAAGQGPAEANRQRAQAIYAAIVGAQLIARSQANIVLYDQLIENYRAAGLLPN